MNLQQFRAQAQEREVCCHYCGRNLAYTSERAYVHEDGVLERFPYCRRCERIASTVRWDQERRLAELGSFDVVDRLVEATALRSGENSDRLFADISAGRIAVMRIRVNGQIIEEAI